MAPLGRPVIYFHRSFKATQFQIIRTACIFSFVIATTLVVINLSKNDSEGPLNPMPNLLKSSTSKKSFLASKTKVTVLSIQGNQSSYYDIKLENIPNPDTLTELSLKFIELDPENFTETLKKFKNLKKLSLERVKIVSGSSFGWNFSRVLLPNLKEFTLDLDIGFHDQYTDYMKDLLEENVSQLLFYDKISSNNNKSMDMGEKLSDDKVQTILRVDGWTALSITFSESNSVELILAVKFADKLIKRFNELFNVSHLTMTECSVSKLAFVKTLQFLNLYRVEILDGNITEVFNSTPMPNLTDLYLEMRNSTMSISTIPKSVKNLAIGDIINAKYQPGDTSLAEKVGLSYPLDPDIITNFDSIFLKVSKVGIFEPENGTQHILLKNVLKTNAQWILLEGFERPNNTSGKLTEVEIEMEAFLKSLGIASEERNVLLVKDQRTLTWTQMQLTDQLKLQFRYEILGWIEFIAWNSFSVHF